MKIIAYATRPDEQFAFDNVSKELDCEIKYINEGLSIENASEASGFEYVTILGHCDASREVLKKLSNLGIKCLSSRSAGFDNIDTEAAKEYGIEFFSASYSPNCVADFALMHILMAIRNFKMADQRGRCQDFSLRGIRGREMKNLTVGVVGTGRIGTAVIKNLSGFGCKIIGYDPYKNEGIKEYIEYVDLDTLFAKADVITLHVPYTTDSHHMIDSKSIDRMKKDVVIINTSRGELIDTDALINGLETGKISAAGLDVLEGEVGIFHNDMRFDTLNCKNMSILKNMPNVTLTHHFAFYTDQAVYDMVECGLKNIHAFKNGI